MDRRSETMATTKQRQRRDEEPAQGNDVRDALAATDWRRMTDVAHDHIAHRAYQLYEERGRQPGHDLDDWLKAEHDIEERR
jgi:DUF2934 family protein